MRDSGIEGSSFISRQQTRASASSSLIRESIMDWPEFLDHRAPAARQARVFDAIVSYRYLAPAYLALMERQHQADALPTQEPGLSDGTNVDPGWSARARRLLTLWTNRAALRHWRARHAARWPLLPEPGHAQPADGTD
jgi:hypothetical protein